MNMLAYHGAICVLMAVPLHLQIVFARNKKCCTFEIAPGAFGLKRFYGMLKEF